MSAQSQALVWFRQDLRSQWHSPLHYALQHHDKVCAVYCLPLKQWQEYGWAKAKINLTLQRLEMLHRELQALGVPLHIVDAGDFQHAPEVLTDFARQHKVKRVYANAEYEWDERVRDQRSKELLVGQDIELGWFHDTTLVKPHKLLTKTGTPFKVFTPFYNNWITQLHISPPSKMQKRSSVADAATECDLSEYHQLSPISLNADTAHIKQQLSCFLEDAVSDYHVDRDYPAIAGTSGVSAYLACGALSPAECAYYLQMQQGQRLEHKGSGSHTWLKELAWRDFYRYLMFHFPHVAKGHCFVQHYDNLPWQADKQKFQAWCEGKTGFPIVDAAMRCLNATGWMHNRLRMIVASFFCKDLHLPWRWGEDYFMQQLLDGDFASNNGGWQWSASVGADAAPYFRVFNPTLQSQKYDPQGEFIAKWCPELAGLSAKSIHEPHKYADVDSLAYPPPIVEHKQAAEQAKQLFKQYLDELKQEQQ